MSQSEVKAGSAHHVPPESHSWVQFETFKKMGQKRVNDKYKAHENYAMHFFKKTFSVAQWAHGTLTYINGFVSCKYQGSSVFLLLSATLKHPFMSICHFNNNNNNN